MGLLRKLQRAIGLAQENEDRVAKAVSEKSSRLDESDVKKGIDKAGEMAGESGSNGDRK